MIITGSWILIMLGSLPAWKQIRWLIYQHDEKIKKDKQTLAKALREICV